MAAEWTPVLAGADGREALELAQRLGDELLASTDRQAAGLMAGAAGLAVAHSYLDEALPDRGHAEAAGRRLEEALAGLARIDSPDLEAGRGGIAWASYHLTGEFLPDYLPALAGLTARTPTPYSHDYLQGLAGLHACALEAPAGTDDDAVAAITRHVAQHWAGLVPGKDLGLAHGLAAPFALLARARAPLAGERWEWLRARRSLSALAWCNGDLGIAAALAAAAAIADRADWQERAAELATTVAGETVDPGDAALCHGTAGIAHLFLRLHHALGDPLLAEAARVWCRRVLADPGVLGTGILHGVAGVALVLVAAATDRPPAWDRLLLVSA